MALSLSLIISSVGDTAIAGGILLYARVIDLEVFSLHRSNPKILKLANQHFNLNRHYKYADSLKESATYLESLGFLNDYYDYIPSSKFYFHLYASETQPLIREALINLINQASSNYPGLNVIIPNYKTGRFCLYNKAYSICQAGEPFFLVSQLAANLQYKKLEEQRNYNFRQAYGVNKLLACRTVDHVSLIFNSGPSSTYHRRSALRTSYSWIKSKKYQHIRQFRYYPPAWWKVWFPNENYFVTK